MASRPASHRTPLHPLPTRDPISGGELIVTRLECPASGVVLEGRFGLGWIGALTPEQLEFVGQLVRHRGNVQRLAGELNVAYNTARSRLDGVVAALDAPGAGAGAEAEAEAEAGAEAGAAERRRREVSDVLDRLATGELGFDAAIRQLKRPAP
jgi:hypothetical protein